VMKLDNAIVPVQVPRRLMTSVCPNGQPDVRRTSSSTPTGKHPADRQRHATAANSCLVLPSLAISSTVNREARRRERRWTIYDRQCDSLRVRATAFSSRRSRPRCLMRSADASPMHLRRSERQLRYGLNQYHNRICRHFSAVGLH